MLFRSVMGSAPRAGELKIPYFIVSEGHHVASGKLNRYTFQPGITDVRSQVISMAPWIAKNFLTNGRPLFNEKAWKMLVNQGHGDRARRLLP